MEAEEIRGALQRLAGRIVEDREDSGKLALVGIHTGGVFLAERLQRIVSEKYGRLLPMGTLDINLYRDDWTRLHHQPLVRATDLPFPVEDRDIVLVDDVLYTGRTIRAALDALMDYGRPKRVELCVLVDRGHRELPICARYTGLEVKTAPDEQVNVCLQEKSGYDKVTVDRPA
jgi:pyrimidine operon attenuation protein/uracil phosphoribosyltransferase